MNCIRCGNQLPPNTAACPVCGEAIYAPQAYAQPPVTEYPNPAVQPGMTQQTVYQQSYAQYQPGVYPPRYQTPYGYGQTASREERSFLATLGELPRAFLDSFTRPGEVLRAIVERNDLYACPIVAVLVLALSFLCGMVLMRGFLGVMLSVISTLSGVSLASGSASMNQGVNYIAGRVGAMTGGIAALCQLIAMIVPAAVYIVYLCAVRKVAFSWILFLGFIAVTSLPTVAVSLLTMALSLLSPWLAVLVIICGSTVSLMQACAMLSPITGVPDSSLFTGKLVCILVAILLTLVLGAVAGRLLMGGVMQRVLILIKNVGSLI